jgi:hypothetical protein
MLPFGMRGMVELALHKVSPALLCNRCKGCATALSLQYQQHEAVLGWQRQGRGLLSRNGSTSGGGRARRDDEVVAARCRRVLATRCVAGAHAVLGAMAHRDLVQGVGGADAVIALFTHQDRHYAYEGTRFEVAFALGRGIPVFAVVPDLLDLCEARSDAFTVVRDGDGKERSRTYTGPAYARSFGIAAPGVVHCKSFEDAVTRATA